MRKRIKKNKLESYILLIEIISGSIIVRSDKKIEQYEIVNKIEIQKKK